MSERDKYDDEAVRIFRLIVGGDYDQDVLGEIAASLRKSAAAPPTFGETTSEDKRPPLVDNDPWALVNHCLGSKSGCCLKSRDRCVCGCAKCVNARSHAIVSDPPFSSARESGWCTCVDQHGIDQRGACSVCKKVRIILSKPEAVTPGQKLWIDGCAWRGQSPLEAEAAWIRKKETTRAWWERLAANGTAPVAVEKKGRET